MPSVIAAISPDLASVLAINAANEGVPVAAIARIVHVPYDGIVEFLQAAKLRGELVDMPRADWPPGAKLHDRLPSLPLPDDADLQFLCGKAFRLTPLEAAFLTTLLKNRQTDKVRLHSVVEHLRQARQPNDHEATDPKMVDVIICKLRKKLKIVDAELKIETIWGSGYYIESTMKPKIVSHLDGATNAPQESPASVFDGPCGPTHA